MRNILVLILLFFSLSASAAKKTVYVYYESGIDYITIRLKNGTMKTLTAKDGDRYEHFDDYYEFDKSLIEPVVISGSREPLCLGGVVYLTNSRSDADFLVKEVSSDDYNYDCTIRIVDESSPDCDEWRITPYSSTADRKVYIVPKNELGYDYKVRIIR
ncbi:MAG: hypothetical protein K6D57_04455 [Paludibacteraceae bacterium]|nr:hypothetical protein [Paludibacteraceae bacterium]